MNHHPKEYREKDYSKLRDLNGIPDAQIEMHLELYAGYGKNANVLGKKLAELLKGKKSGQPEFAEIKRRLAFEFNGMRLHEYYFDNLRAGGGGDEPPDAVAETFESAFGSFAR